MRKRVNGRLLNRFCDKCGAWCGRSNRPRMWTKLTGTRLGNEKDETMYCTRCLTPEDASRLVVRLASFVDGGHEDPRTL